MSLFGNIMNKIFHHKTASPASQADNSQTTPNFAPQAAGTATLAPAPAAAPTAASAQNVDVGQVLGEMAAMKNGGGNYKTSIVDLLKLLDLDSSLSARKELASELGVHAGEDGSAEQNIALHKAVMAKLAENGGVVPDDLRN
ncbi:DUF3597 domain-containing protein [Sphingomonas piscis]|uniref:DUF3597 domain-containing protein n=1 Tax=Sphingomonas piscis TaxID=2714943 RepID=A0A6G7YLQ6_9SPHN|nr:DUF3597 domain-containing protein [Sphingomonas piscis]QIK77646.1 DUF3597 domain-containing protein [Sphingomonas piscis]